MAWKRNAIALAVGLVVNSSATARVPQGAPAPPSYPLWEFGTIPRPAFKQVLLGVPAVQDELKLTEAQKEKIGGMTSREAEKVQKARAENTNREKFLAAREGILKEIHAATLEILEPGQRDRLDQIQLRSQGPIAFSPRIRRLAFEGPDLAQRLKLTDDQARRAGEVADAGYQEIERAASVPIALDPKSGAPTPESIRKLVESPEFRAAKRKAREDARQAWASVVQGIEQILTEPQRTAYREMLGTPFDLSKIRFGDEATEDADNVASALNVGGGGGGGGQGQRADPNFDTKVARPAYVAEHPRVLFDEAHHNFHTTDGRYRPFAELIANDGCKVLPSKGKFTGELLAGGDILIIANALGAAGMGQPGASNPAFTEAECDAVRDWVRAGGSLLLITDHAPFGSAAQSLAGRFGVDMSKGYTSDPSNSEGGATSLVFSRKNGLLGDHAITRGRDESERVNRVQTFTGQSLKGPAGSVAILKLGQTAFDEGDDGKTTSAAGRAQGVAFAFGEGRVVVLGEAAELSAQVVGTERFGMNVPGLDNRQMALNILHWLSGLLEPRGGLRKKAG
jgi:hypothetical protein